MRSFTDPCGPGASRLARETVGRSGGTLPYATQLGGTVHVILDVSRLLFCVHRTSPSGIERVEMAYARRWLACPDHDVTFTAQSLWGWFATLPKDQVAA